MRIFISHSSVDSWAARQISQQLEELGAVTFLDEKDIETGESIDSTIHEQLRLCDELLMLLSPVALSSHWVMIEIGGARALEKRLVPILFHVGANELPAPISGTLARDINEIERYYEEVAARLSNSAPVGSSVPDVSTSERSVQPPRYSVGDIVRIVNQPQYTDRSSGGGIGWVSGMDSYCGFLAQVLHVNDSWGIARLDVDHGTFGWAVEWLTPVPPGALGTLFSSGGSPPYTGPLPSLEQMRRDAT